jgi:mannan endo-1,4-beta-mannosidase
MGLTSAVRGAGVRKAAGGVVTAVALALGSAPACSAVSDYRIAAPPKPPPLPRLSVATLGAGSASHWINGVALAGMGDLRSWEAATGEHPAVIATFGRFGAPFPLWAMRQALASRAIPLLQLDPSGISVAAIARGAYDRELRAYNAAIRSLNDPVFMSFGHEMNGVWYSWGCGQTSPGTFRAAWRHVHSLITAPQVTWVWTINDIWDGDPCPLRAWYPGAAYVDWVGIDGYLRPPVDTFTSAFGRTLAALHRIARGKPVLLAETGVPWAPGWTRRLSSLYAGAHRAGLRGILYFDGMTSNGDYRPQDHARALAAFRKILRKWS